MSATAKQLTSFGKKTNMSHNLPLTYDLDFQFPASTVMIYSQTTVQGQRSVSSEDRVETNGRTYRRSEATALRSVIKKL